MKKVLVLTHEEDPHADAVCEFFKNNNVPYCLVATEKIQKDYKLHFDSSSLLYTISNNKNKEIEIDSSWNIWNRRVMNPDTKKGFAKDLKDIIIDETEKAWDGLLISHKGKVVNKPHNQIHANNKIEQIIFASKFKDDIKIPDTIVTNDPDKVIDFYDKHRGNICYKLQKGALVNTPTGSKIIYTNKVSKENMKNVDLVSQHPSLFQEYIDKEFEIRIVTIGNESIGTAIYSQNSEISKVDYRKYDFENVRYEHINLPDNVKNFCSSMLKEYNLHFGVFDFIYSKNKDYVFLELNPNGQWLWLEHLSKFKISEKLGAYLAE
jgi:glutathione synthase/RimK-type ligase-like ATP-grasp enzyme